MKENKTLSSYSFYQDLEILEKIPVLPVLLPEYSGEDIPDESSETSEAASEPNKLTLLQWIKASDKKSTMDGLFEHCAKGLEQVNIVKCILIFL